ncbi:hypothetical protein GCM10009127_15850 [Alteraurantiacibacter aestuarii]|uniref:Lipoprotein n=1 Tax=Alteraurantiacibacter aestuarii TaxID=650004 RepID=A0A844ZQD9_9SPHN|nr:hypothetical protein [Alteraurantiacibacter aestuarii]MXO87829.1 hypothetical protein [Alteraurantiacibacter aestuarii]
MKRPLILLGLAVAAPLTLVGCANHMTYGVGMSWYSHPYSVWYDGFYGPFYDGYWGTDGYFYFRLDMISSAYRRADPGHFYRQPPARNMERYRHYEGRSYEPPRGTRMPNYPARGDGSRDRDRPRDRDRD